MSVNKVQPKVIIHGGAGSAIHDESALVAVRDALHSIVEQVYDSLLEDTNATDAVITGCRLLEDHPRFNAGTGSVLQSDGQIRMSAALMEGTTQRFSGVINVSRIRNPIDLAQALISQTDRILSDNGAVELARELHLPLYDPTTELRLQEWARERKNNFRKSMAGVVAEREEEEAVPAGEARRGTIGVVVRDSLGNLAVGTSTGGKGLERIGRVSDSAMPAGNYSNKRAAVSCTGIGEDIIDECLAAKIVVRVTDGLTLEQAVERSFRECQENRRDLGAISIDAEGKIAWGKTSEVLLAAYHDGKEIGDTLEWTDREALTAYRD